MTEIIIFSIYLFFTGLFTLVLIANLITAPRFKKRKLKGSENQKISVLIPARNEETIIAKCIQNMMKQKYSNFNVFVLDDNSEDRTAEIVDSLTKKYSNLKLIRGKPLPEKWLGKNWACHQLSQYADGEIIIFVDADCILEDHVLESSVYYMKKYKLTLLSCFPTQLMKNFSERLVVPSMNWLLLTFLPLRLVYSSPWLSFVAANGQYMCFRSDEYKKIGGHEAVASKVVEDMEIARIIKKKRLKMMTFVGWNNILCRMYNSFTGAIDGFSKNFYQGFNTSPFAFIVMLIFFALIFIVPFFILPFFLYYIIFVFLISLQRLILSILCKQNIFLDMILHPIQMLIMCYVGIISLSRSRRNKILWKGRWI